MIPETFEGEIIRNGILFMRTITRAYGPDKGMELWNTIANTLDPAIKGKIFFALLTGAYSDKLTCEIDPNNYNGTNRVEGIKVIRTITGLGLKEAKDLHDDMVAGKMVTLNLSIDPTKALWAIHELNKVDILAR